MALTATVLTGQRDAPVLTITAVSRAVQPGELVVLTVASAGPLEAIRARAFDRALLAYQSDPRTWTVLVGIDLDVKPGVYTVAIESGAAVAVQRATHRLAVVSKSLSNPDAQG